MVWGQKRGPPLPASWEGSLVRGTQAHLRSSDIWQFSRLWPCDQLSGRHGDLLSLVKGKSVPPKFLFQRPLATERTAFPPFPQDSLPGLTQALWCQGVSCLLPHFPSSLLTAQHSAFLASWELILFPSSEVISTILNFMFMLPLFFFLYSFTTRMCTPNTLLSFEWF